MFGYRAGIKKDQANRAAASHSNHKYDANARKADAARAADRASAASLNDWRKSADGWNAAQAARAQAANAEQRVRSVSVDCMPGRKLAFTFLIFFMGISILSMF